MMDPYFQRTIYLHVLLFTTISLSTTTPLKVQSIRQGSVLLPCPCADKGKGIRWSFSGASLQDPIETPAGHIVEWDGDGVIVYPQRETVSENKYRLIHWGSQWGHLRVNSLSLGDEGNYSCESSVEGNSPWSCDVSLTVNVPVTQAFITHRTGNDRNRFLDADEVVLLKENQLAIFKCYTFSAKPHANITWYHSGRKLTINVRSYVHPSYNHPGQHDTIGKLTVKRASILGYHLHTLTCRSVGAGSSVVKRSIMIHIIAPLHQPIIAGTPSFTITSVSSPLELTCRVINSFPPASLDWSIERRKAFHDKHSTNLKSPTGNTNCDENPAGHSTNQVPPIVKLQNVTNMSRIAVRRNKNGKYDVTSRLVMSVNHTHDGNVVKCVARYPDIYPDNAEESELFKLDIKYPPTFISSNVTRATRAHNHGNAITNITCIYDANPVSQVHWLVPSIFPENSSHVERCSGTQTLSQLTLSIPINQRGELQVKCYANNSIGSTNQTIDIKIEHLDRTTQTLQHSTENEHMDRTTQTLKRSTENDIGARNTEAVSNTQGKDIDARNTKAVSNTLGKDQGLLSTHETSHSTTKREMEYKRPAAKIGFERILLIVTSSTSVIFMVWVLLLLMKRRWFRGKHGPHDRSTFYVDMSSRRRVYQVAHRQENLPSPTDSEVFTSDSDQRQPFRTNIGGRFFTQQSVENTYDIIPVGRASPPAFQPRRRRVQSADGMFYDIPPPARGPDTIRRVQSRRLPAIPAFLATPGTTNTHTVDSPSNDQLQFASQHSIVSQEGQGSDSSDTPQQDQIQVQGVIDEDAPYQTPENVSPMTPSKVLRTVSSDTRAPRIPELKDQCGGHSEKIIREHVALLKKMHSPVRRVFSL